MRRRNLLAALGTGAAASLAGCSGVLRTPNRNAAAKAPPVVETRPSAVYIPTHVEGMKMAGMAAQNGYRAALTYTYPHRFWVVTGSRRKKVGIESGDSVHLMPVVWNAETEIVPPDLGPQLTVTKGGKTITRLRPWPMLSQPMGFHFGDNVQLSGEGTYTVTVTLGGSSTPRFGVTGNPGNAAFEFEFDFSRSELRDITYRDIPENKQGTRGALDPMKTKNVPSSQVPRKDSLPGTVRGTATSGDARFVVSTFGDASRFDGDADQAYVAVSPRTPYNRYLLPLMSLSGTLERGGETIYDDIFRAAIGSELGYHYGAVVPDVNSGDALSLSVDAPPQVSRHEGYETAFFEMAPMTLKL